MSGDDEAPFNYREQVEYCCRQAEKSPDLKDKAAWLKVAADWLRMAEDAERDGDESSS